MVDQDPARGIIRGRGWLALAIAVLAAAAAVPLLRTQLAPAPEPAPPSPVVTTTPDGQLQIVYDVDFAETGVGYALRGHCAVDGPCRTELLVNESGERWAPRTLPAGYRVEYSLSRTLHVLGPRWVVVELSDETTTTRWYSDDGGLTWRPVPVVADRPMRGMPDGAILEVRCGPSGCAESDQVMVMDPRSGSSARLANPPPLRLARPGPIQAADGGWWVSGKDPATGRWALAVSRDGGGSWSVSVLPELDGAPVGSLSVSGLPGVLYATAVGQLPDVRNGLLAIFVSTDGGQTWSRTWQPAPEREPRSIGGVPIPESDGGLLVATETGVVYHSGDGGKTFEETTQRLGWVRWTRLGYLAGEPGSDNEFSLYSLHRFGGGASWRRLTVG